MIECALGDLGRDDGGQLVLRCDGSNDSAHGGLVPGPILEVAQAVEQIRGSCSDGDHVGRAAVFHGLDGVAAVSYTHLTLPTILLV